MGSIARGVVARFTWILVVILEIRAICIIGVEVGKTRN